MSVCISCKTTVVINPFPHIDAFVRLCSRQLFENMATKEKIAQNEQFLYLSPCFQPQFNYCLLLFKGVVCAFA